MQSPEFYLQCHVNLNWWCTFLTPTVSKGKLEGHTFKALLDCISNLRPTCGIWDSDSKQAHDKAHGVSDSLGNKIWKLGYHISFSFMFLYWCLYSYGSSYLHKLYWVAFVEICFQPFSMVPFGWMFWLRSLGNSEACSLCEFFSFYPYQLSLWMTW